MSRENYHLRFGKKKKKRIKCPNNDYSKSRFAKSMRAE
jgi:hypothetical protein